MKIWIIATGEPLPTDADKSRLYRGGLICELLAQAGHEVIWWSSTFNHALKIFRFKSFTEINYKPRLRIKLLHGCDYKSNVSLARLRNHAQVAKEFLIQAKRFATPDIIFCAMPTINLANAAVLIGQENNIPVVLDMRDMWPDIFIDVLPAFFRPLGQLAISPMKSTLRKAAQKATAITGITPGFVKWGLSYAGRSAQSWDRDFPLAYSANQPSESQIQEGFKFWESFGITKKDSIFNICFFGSMGRQINLNTVILAARQLRGNPYIKFILCGDGDRFQSFKQLASECKNIIFPGWVNSAQIWTLMRCSKTGLAPYKNKIDFQISYPNKPIEYLSAGLPILSSLQGDLEKLISSHKCGITYEENNAEDLIRKIDWLRNNHDELGRMSTAAQKLFKDRFQSEKVYSDLKNYLESLSTQFKMGSIKGF